MSEVSKAQGPQDVVVVGAARTAQGRMLGGLSSLSAVDLGSEAIKGVLDRSGISADSIDYVLMGQVVQAGSGQNPAKQAAVKAGVSINVPAVTINKVCLSGLDAVVSASRLIRLGDAQVVIAGGQESMSNAPFVAPGVRAGHKYGAMELLDALERDGLSDPNEGTSMGKETDEHAQEAGLTREEQDNIAALSHQRAEAAVAEGKFAAEILPIEIQGRKGSTVVDTDEGIRPGTTAESLAKLRPAFIKDGTITAASSSPISDGASALILTTRENAEAQGWTVLATLGEYGQTAGPTTSLLSQPSQAISAALDKAGWSASDLDFVEINEAFGAVVAQSLKDLDYPLEKTNIHGGAIALGHPIGCSGARLVVHAVHELASRGEGKAAVSLCGGGGQGDALLLFR
ncbi:acetyl-CoA C-acetyltransferase [Corynebacterium sp. 320]|uniref:Probable acetyl-CoA acetyltransferase n=1 Tax=Corynebacterium zhongnanshanii TaxID=2768834 RepID=A0ABQ6VF38_9CORY|nr:MULTISPECIES: acetyl-CoA C-acetyltransferase [Corynebacterium]KAB1504115.1 acetyl-CoA C-acetyltransferase [Corynebacterium sp. 320]KAB1552785.1 acetyl-CoA C-acetyltransferase [Corynebacterium sp. 321]KAB1553997.1 acetyl-CoA C-acetyltransferase [Corynebacterium sp. 319]KAB3523032.1 acetyl-CoA C-acetyltransferase [Corynebacterium zhongnanshanii]KAB3528251.1 acetyl-CoA C-acetyltransferase [Corynebacterium sp. 250]